MIFSTFFEEQHKLLIPIGILCVTVFTFTCLCLYLCLHHRRHRNEKHDAIAKKRLLYSSPASITPQIPTKATNRFVFPLPKIETSDSSSKFPAGGERLSQISINEIPSDYKTFDLAKRYQRYLSSDSSYASSNPRRSQPPISFAFETVKSRIQQVHRRSAPTPNTPHPLETINSQQQLSSDSDDDGNQTLAMPSTPSFEYSLTDIFRMEILYKVYYSNDDKQLAFQLLRLTPMQPLIERCFPTLMCKIRLFSNDDKRKTKKYFSKKNPINELFKFDLDQYTLEQSYLKIQVFGQQKNDKRLELGHVILVLNQYNHLMIRAGHHYDGGLQASEQLTKSIPINEDRIDMITQQQITSENEARALICLVYENDRCLLHVGLIKIIGLQTLLKQSTSHSHHRDLIQIKICTIIDGKITAKKKSKAIPIEKNALTFSTSFQFDYLSLHKTSVRITISYRKKLISSQNKFISSLEFGSTQLKNQQGFQHWTDTLSAPNRPHIHWHTLQRTETASNDK